jgi:hypothetical protein
MQIADPVRLGRHGASMRRPVESLIVVWALLLFCLLQRTVAQGDQRADTMLEALKSRQYLELADHYLDALSDSSFVSDEWKRKIPFERAALIVQFASSSQSDDVDARLAEATDLLKRFVVDNPGTPEADDASMELAKLRMAQGHRAVALAEREEDATARKKLLDQAGTAFRSAESQFRHRKNVLNDQLKAIQKSPEAQQDQAALDKMRSDLLFARMTVAMLEYDQATLTEDDQKKYQEQMQAALKEFGKISKEFRERLIGLEAIYYQARCYEDLGDLETALDYYEQLLQLTGLPESLTARTLARAITCHVKQEQVARAITLGEKWLARGGDHQQTTEAADGKVRLAEAYIAAAKLESGRKQQRNVDAAKAQLVQALRVAGPHQVRARSLLSTLPARSVKQGSAVDLGDFASAKLAAEQSRDQMQATSALVDLQRRKVQTSEDDQRRAAARTELEAAEQNLKRFQASTLQQYRQTLAVVNDDVPTDQLNEVRTMIAYLLYQQDRFWEAATVAEFVADRYPDSESAKECANIAMACYWSLYQQAPVDDRTFETARMIRVADTIATRWPGGVEAQGALVNLVNLTISQGDAAKAESYLNRIPEDSAVRISAELRTGVGLWRLWLRQSKKSDSDVSADEALWQRAEVLLTSALEKSRDKRPDAVVVQAALALAQLRIETGRAAEAIALLRDEQIGPQTLVEAQHEAVSGPGFVEQTYRALLAALIGQLAQATASPDAIVREATATMDALKQFVGDSPDGQRRLLTTYVALAKDLRQQIEAAPEDTKSKLRKGFVAFLDRVSESADTLILRNWVADTYLDMADDILGEEPVAKLPQDARGYYENALVTFSALLEMPDDTDGMSPDVRTQLRLQMASASRRLGKHKEAIDLFEEVLKQRNNIISVQLDAAQTFQEAGAVGSNNLYELAMKGARKDADGKKTIWGWERLARIAAGQMRKRPDEEARYSDLFFRSRFNVAQCRYLQAQRATGDERSKYRQQAIRAIKLTRSLYPDLGGEPWKARFTELAEKTSGLGES